MKNRVGSPVATADSTASSFGSAIGTSGNDIAASGVSSRRRYWARTSPNSCTKRFHAASVVRASSPSARRIRQ